ncbi:MAG: HAD family phosphatase [Blautia sp.]|mgnify:FL=1|nr:HAD family phosphatase [Blautia sp.]
MNKHYRAIALDMDGTVLNTDKVIDPVTTKAIHEALAKGKEVIFCTGRSYVEMTEVLKEFPEMHYLCGESGALVYDLKADRPLACHTMEPKVFLSLMEISKERNLMPYFFSEGRDFAQSSHFAQLDRYQMGEYSDLMGPVVTLSEDIYATAKERCGKIEKLLLLHTSPEQRAETLSIVKQNGIPAAFVYAERSSLECSAVGINKASGLKTLCEKLNITMDQIIMVGDGDNDLAALKASGLPIAMGNANENVKKTAHVVVADNDHAGCAEAIYKYLLCD